MYTQEKNKPSCGKTKNILIDFLGEKVNIDFCISKSNYTNTGILYGKIVNNHGTSIPKALVKIVTLNYEPILCAETDIEGNYFFSNIPVNTCYKLIVMSKGYKLKKGKEFYIRYNSIIKLDVTLFPEINDSLSLIVGDVFNKCTSLPINTATIMLYKILKDSYPLYEIMHTNEFGQFAFTNLEPGGYIVKIYIMGYRSKCYKICINKCSQIVNMLIPLCPNNTSLKGTVSGVITDQHNKPVNEADVILYKLSTNNSLVPIDFTRTNKDGLYLFINVDIGNYIIKANQKHWFSRTISSEADKNE